MDITGFFSYAHADDAYDFLTHLKHDLCCEFNMISGSTLDLFIDRDSISWGDNWRKSITSGINDASFFIPILSPNYFKSGACKTELTQYIQKSQELGARDLLLPLLLIDVKSESLALDTELVSKVLEYQYLDIRELRYLDRGSGGYIRTVHKAAQQLWDANTHLVSMAEAGFRTSSNACRDFSESEENGGDGETTDATDGFILESMNDFQPTLDEMTRSIESINSDIVTIGACVSKTNDRMEQKQGLGQFNPSVALALTGKLAQELAPVSSDYAEHADQFLNSVNKAERVLSPLIKYWVDSESEEGELESFRNLISSTEDARANVQYFKESIQPAKRLSRSLFNIMQSIESSTSVCLAAMDIVIGWKELLDGRG